MSDQMNGTSGVDEKQQFDVAPQNTSDGSTDTGASRRPRDARIIHLILASMGVHAYHERVPLQIMDFAYRYTSAVLQDALLYSDAGTNGPGASSGLNNPSNNITVEDLRMSIASRVNHQFNTALPKEFLLDIAAERNRIALPPVDKGYGIRLPPEKYCLTGVNWELVGRDEWAVDDEDEEEEEEGEGVGIAGIGTGVGGGGIRMGGGGGGDGMEGIEGSGGGVGTVGDEDAQGEDDDMAMDEMFGGGGGGEKDGLRGDSGGSGGGDNGGGATKDENMTDA